MKTIKETKVYNYQINGSKFISICFYVESAEQIDNILERIRQEHKRAKHICFAYRIENKQKASDDNEPANSAGKKILESILINDLNNILIVVIRYMNGTKLGIGLLSRSYYNSASLICSDIDNITELELIDLYQISTNYEKANRVIEILIKNNQVIFDKKPFNDSLIIQTSLTKNLLELFDKPIFLKKIYYKKNL